MSTPREPPRFFDRPGVRIVLGVSIAMLLFFGLGAWYVLGAGDHPLTVANALDRFRGNQNGGPDAAGSGATSSARPSGTAGPTASPGRRAGSNAPRSPAKAGSPTIQMPEAGVYVYATSGGEQTDALSGQQHQYPSQTTITLEHSGCGTIARWQPLSERWDESEACKVSRGIALRRFTMYHEFFHHGVQEDFTCGSDAVVMPSTQTAGDHWTFRCHSPSTTLDMAVSVIGFESVDVGGRAIRAVHIRYDGKVSGADNGTEVQDRWLARDNGLFLRIVSSADIQTSTSFGRAHYLEHYRIDLSSTSPER